MYSLDMPIGKKRVGCIGSLYCFTYEIALLSRKSDKGSCDFINNCGDFGDLSTRSIHFLLPTLPPASTAHVSAGDAMVCVFDEREECEARETETNNGLEVLSYVLFARISSGPLSG